MTMEKIKKILKFNKDNIQSLNELCAPLTHLGIEYFSYVRVYDNNKGIRIGNHYKFNEFMLKNEVTNSYQDIINVLVDSASYISHAVPNRQFKKATEYCNINPVLVSMHKNNNYLEGWGIYTKDSQEIFHNYNQMVPILYRFISHFTLRSNSIIREALEKRILFDTLLNFPSGTIDIKFSDLSKNKKIIFQ